MKKSNVNPQARRRVNVARSELVNTKSRLNLWQLLNSEVYLTVSDQ